MPAPTLPFAHLNLRWNPFGEAEPDERAAMAVIDVSPWLEHLRASRTAIRFVGDHGRGKSTRLLALRDALPSAVHFRAARGDPPRTLPRDAIVLIDEFARLDRRSARWLLRDARNVVVALHDGERDGLERAGFDVLTVRVGGVNVAELRAICAQRVEWARRAEGPVPVVSDAAGAALIREHSDDIRAMESHLYEVFQQLPSPSTIGREDIRCARGG